MSGENKTEIEEKLKTAARISKDLSRNDVINNEDSEQEAICLQKVRLMLMIP